MNRAASNTVNQEPGAMALKLPMVAIAVLVLVTLGGVAAVRWSGIAISEPDAPVRYSRDLRFDDQADGSIEVFDVRSGALVDTVRGQAGFVRGALRGLARERRRAGIGPALPFSLVAHQDGRLTLMDPSTGRRIDLESFGPTNASEFARLLGPAPAAPMRKNTP